MNKILRIKIQLLSIAVLSIAMFACEDKPDVYEFPVDEYIYDIPDVPVIEDYVVGVSYDVIRRDTLHNVWWNGTKSAPLLYTGTPQLGEYDIKDDVDVLRQHLQWGKEAGIDFFILSWSGHGYNDTILSNWEQLYAQDPDIPKVAIRFDVGYRFPKAVSDTMMLNPLVMDSLKFDFDSLYVHVMQKDYAFKNKGVPAMVLTNFTNQANVTSANKLTSILKGINSVNGNLWIMAELQGRWTSPERWGYNSRNGYTGGTTTGWVQPDTIKAFDSFFITDISTDNKDRYDGFYSYLDYNYKYWQQRMLPLGKEYLPTIMPSFDNLVNDPVSNTFLIPRWKEGSGAYVVSGSEPDAPEYNWSSIKENPYKTLANVAKRNVGPSRIVIIYGWNNFTNGINLEPTQEFGTDYLLYTKQFFKR